MKVTGEASLRSLRLELSLLSGAVANSDIFIRGEVEDKVSKVSPLFGL